jgi:hypothetical protein
VARVVGPAGHVGAESARPPECAGELGRGREPRRARVSPTGHPRGRGQARWNGRSTPRPMMESTTAGVTGVGAGDDNGGRRHTVMTGTALPCTNERSEELVEAYAARGVQWARAPGQKVAGSTPATSSTASSAALGEATATGMQRARGERERRAELTARCRRARGLGGGAREAGDGGDRRRRSDEEDEAGAAKEGSPARSRRCR